MKCFFCEANCHMTVWKGDKLLNCCMECYTRHWALKKPLYTCCVWKKEGGGGNGEKEKMEVQS